MNVWIEISASNYLSRITSRTRKKSAKVIDLIWPQLTSVDLRRTGWPVECMSTTWYYMSRFISLAKTAMFASYVPRNAFSAWHDPSYDVIGQMLGGSGSWNFQGGRKKDGRKAIEKMVTIERLTKKIFQKNRRGVASTPPVPARVKDVWIRELSWWMVMSLMSMSGRLFWMSLFSFRRSWVNRSHSAGWPRSKSPQAGCHPDPKR